MPAQSHTPARAAKFNWNANCFANTGSSAAHKRGQMAECPRQRLPQNGLQNPKATCIAKTFGFLQRTIATKYANHRASGYPDAVAAIWASTNDSVSCVCRSQPQARPRLGNIKRANINLASRNPQFAEATKKYNEPFSARAKHKAPHANICWPQTRGSFASRNRGQTAELPRQRLLLALAKTLCCMYTIATAANAATRRRAKAKEERTLYPKRG